MAYRIVTLNSHHKDFFGVMQKYYESSIWCCEIAKCSKIAKSNNLGQGA